MPNRLVPHAEWFQFLRAFSKRHENELVSISVFTPDLGSQVEARDLPLHGVLAGRRTGAPISISAGRPPSGLFAHEITDPIQIWVKLSAAGVEEVLDIESQDRTRTIIQIGSGPAPPPPLRDP